jgi:hypothetical protein
VFVGVLVGVSVGVFVGVFVGVLVGVSVGVFVGVLVGVSVGVFVGVLVGVSGGVSVGGGSWSTDVLAPAKLDPESLANAATATTPITTTLNTIARARRRTGTSRFYASCSLSDCRWEVNFEAFDANHVHPGWTRSPT